MTGLGRPDRQYWGCLVRRSFVGLVRSLVFQDYCSGGQWSCYRTILSRLTHFGSSRRTRSLLVLLRSSNCACQLLDAVFPNVGGRLLDLDLVDTNVILQFSSTPRYLVHLGIVLLESKRVLCMV
jgi:hypothetical protein